MKKSSGFFGSFFAGRNEAAAPRRDQSPPTSSGTPYKKGDLIGGKYEVHGVLGKGGFGVVYLVYSRETETVYALKTFRDEYLANIQIRERFKKEAQVWVDLERHPYLLRAYLVDGIAGRLYIGTDYIAPNEESLNSLEGYLERKPPDLAQTLRWAIQFCYGMEYAYGKGIRCHRDIKPANILISQDKTVKIADFGLAGVLAPMETGTETGHPFQPGQTMAGTSFGTPTHMPPEQFTDAASCDEKSDIYSFGVVLYQMAVGGRLPFLAAPPKNDLRDEQMRFWWEMHELHRAAPIPKLDSPLHAVIQRCLAKESNRRYRSFAELRGELETLLHRETGEVFQPVKPEEFAAWEWMNKGVSLANLGRREEAIRCYDRALEIDPRDADAWYNKGVSLADLGRRDEAIHCYDRTLEIDPRYAKAWYNKGNSLDNLGRREEAIRCYDRALEIDPRDAKAWYNKGVSLDNLGRREEAIRCYDRALEIDPRDAKAWYNKGVSLDNLGRREEAIHCYDRALEIDPRDADAWYNKGNSLDNLGRREEAIRCYDRALEIDPRYVFAWNNKGNSLDNFGRREEAIRCYDRALEIDPRFTNAWNNKALAEEKSGKTKAAIETWRKYLKVAREMPSQREWIPQAEERLRKLLKR